MNSLVWSRVQGCNKMAFPQLANALLASWSWQRATSDRMRIRLTTCEHVCPPNESFSASWNFETCVDLRFRLSMVNIRRTTFRYLNVHSPYMGNIQNVTSFGEQNGISVSRREFFLTIIMNLKLARYLNRIKSHFKNYWNTAKDLLKLNPLTE